MAKILIVEDYRPMSSALEDWLEHDSHQVELAESGKAALDMLQVYTYDVVILDWLLPGVNGLEVCKQYRSRGGTAPILMLTGKGTSDDKEIGLDTGADDYLVKPVDFKELSARIRALIRRTSAQHSNELTVGPLYLNLLTREVTRDGEPLHLTPTELSLLELFMRHPKTVFTGDALLDRIWKSDALTSLETIRSFIRMLRKKIDREGQPSLIKTVHGAGYCLEAGN